MAVVQMRSDVLVVKLSEPPLKLIDLLHKKDLNTVETKSLDAALWHLKRMANPIILVYSVASAHVTNQAVERLVGLTALHDFPLVFVGRGIDEHNSKLDQIFRIATTQDLPAPESKIVDLLITVATYAAQIRHHSYEDIIRQRVEDRDAQSWSSPAKSAEADDSTPVSAEALNNRPAPPAELKGTESSVPGPAPEKGRDDAVEEIFAAVDSAISSPGQLAGQAIISGRNVEYFEGMDLKPSDPKLGKSVEVVLEKAAPNTKLHLHRVAYVSGRIRETGLKLEQSEESKAAAFLFAAAFADQSYYCERDYSADDMQEFRAELAFKVREGAMQIRAQMDGEDVPKILEAMAEILEGNAPTEEPHSQVASSIVAADMINRICWSKGRWNTNGAYLFMRKVGQDSSIILPPRVLRCVLRILTEAVNSAASVLLLPRLPAKTRRELKRLRGEAEKHSPGKEELKPVAELTPGSTLARPVFAFDGTKVLEADMVLDNNMILRLWQLSAVKPLLTPMVVLKRSSTASATESEALIGPRLG